MRPYALLLAMVIRLQSMVFTNALFLGEALLGYYSYALIVRPIPGP